MSALPAPVTPGDADADFRVDAPGEVLSWLRELLQTQARVQLSTPDGAAIHTVVQAIDAPHGMLTLEAPQDASVLGPVLSSPELVATAFLDRIKLQFDLSGLVVVRGASDVLRGALPQRLYRFQRRQAYRVHAAGAAYPAFVVKGEPPSRVRVLNVSIGGVAVLWPADLMPIPQPANELQGTVELEREIAVPAVLRVQHVTTLNDGAHQLGCAFASLGPSASRAVQIFIDQAQKRERLMRRG